MPSSRLIQSDLVLSIVTMWFNFSKSTSEATELRKGILLIVQHWYGKAGYTPCGCRDHAGYPVYDRENVLNVEVRAFLSSPQSFPQRKVRLSRRFKRPVLGAVTHFRCRPTLQSYANDIPVRLGAHEVLHSSAWDRCPHNFPSE